jgi:hypothetical protein
LWFGALFPLLVAGVAVLPILRPGRRPVAVLAVAWALALLLDLALGQPYLFPRIAGYPSGFVLETALFGCLVGVGWLTIRKRSPGLRPLGVAAAVLTPVLLLGLADVVAAPFSHWFQDHGWSPVHLLLVLGYLLPAAAVAWVAAVRTRRSDRGARPEGAAVGAGGRPD